MPLRKYVIWALFCFATWRKCEKSLSSFSSAPSQEKTTNCGGFSPGFSFSGLATFGCGPV